MGDRKPKKNSSGSSEAHKARQAKGEANRPPAPPQAGEKQKGKKK